MRIKTFLSALAALVITSTATAKAPKVVKTPAQQLKERLVKLQKRGVMYGHQDDPFYGLTWEYEDGRSDTKDLVGDYPAVMGFDLGGIEKGDAKNLDSVPFTRIHDEIVRHHERGGIITISWHPRNPYIGTTAWIESDIKAYAEALPYLDKIGMNHNVLPNPQNTVRTILPGGEKHQLFMQWLERITNFMKTLKDSKGNTIPVIFRPWHEYNGAWFWWGKGNCSAAEYKALWNMTQDYVNAQIPGAIVWSNSPNLGVNPTEFPERWPGDDRVDLLGLDAYQWGTEAAFMAQCEADMAFLGKYAAEHGLLLAFTECGIKNSPNPVWWGSVLKPIMDKYPVCYFLPWRNYIEEHFGAAPGLPTAEDFKQLVKTKQILLVKDIIKK